MVRREWTLACAGRSCVNTVPPYARTHCAVYALDAATGTQKWTFATGGPVYGSPALAVGEATVFVQSLDGYVWAIATATGFARWRAYLNASGCTGSPVIAGDGCVR
jgi:outer membrane protein assembly factor BamB